MIELLIKIQNFDCKFPKKNNKISTIKQVNILRIIIKLSIDNEIYFETFFSEIFFLYSLSIKIVLYIENARSFLSKIHKYLDYIENIDWKSKYWNISKDAKNRFSRVFMAHRGQEKIEINIINITINNIFNINQYIF
jgi:hypothetical protein